MPCQIIPPFLLQRLVDQAPDDDRRDRRRQTLLIDDRIRSARREPAAAAAAPADSDASRTIHDANNTEQLPGTVARTDGDPPTGDIAVDEAFDSSGNAWDLFADVFDRRSVDANGTPLSVTVHYGVDYANAFWDGRQLVFGDGDGEIFERFTKPMDVLVHEFVHGVTQHSAGLTYQDQSGALNESVSDVFAAICTQWVQEQTVDQADWLIGVGLFKPGVQAKALRSMSDPGSAYDDPQLGKDPQVGSMDDFVQTAEDNGGVHINSGICNRAFQLAATAIGGHSWDEAGPIWYQALTGGEVGPDTDFAGFATATVNAATELFGDREDVVDAVRQGWAEVGVLGPGAPSAQPAGSGRRLSVQRSGGFGGITRTAEVDLDTDPDRGRITALLNRVDFTGFVSSPTQPDRFVYRISYGSHQIAVGEQDLTPELDEAVRAAFDRTE